MVTKLQEFSKKEDLSRKQPRRLRTKHVGRMSEDRYPTSKRVSWLLNKILILDKWYIEIDPSFWPQAGPSVPSTKIGLRPLASLGNDATFGHQRE